MRHLLAPMRCVRGLLELSPAQRQVLLEAAGAVVGVRAALWVLPSRFILQRVRTLAAGAREAPVRESTVDDIVWAVEATSRHLPRATCLTQAIAAQLLLRRRGFASRICIGVGEGAQGRFTAHAWLERDGRILLGAAGAAGLTRLPDLAMVASQASRDRT
jgi:hypothetical protein